MKQVQGGNARQVKIYWEQQLHDLELSLMLPQVHCLCTITKTNSYLPCSSCGTLATHVQDFWFDLMGLCEWRNFIVRAVSVDRGPALLYLKKLCLEQVCSEEKWSVLSQKLDQMRLHLQLVASSGSSRLQLKSSPNPPDIDAAHITKPKGWPPW